MRSDGLDFRSGSGPYHPVDCRFKIARTPSDLEGFWQLRAAVFCREQGLFDSSDRDGIDRNMIPIVAVTLIAGMEDEVIGAVRIDQREPGIWYGSRLCVDCRYRRGGRLSPGVGIRNRQPRGWGGRTIGPGLIYHAVSTAHGLGCRRFLADVQRRNVSLFTRLHWRVVGEVEVHGHPHYRMEADLRAYPAPPAPAPVPLLAGCTP